MTTEESLTFSGTSYQQKEHAGTDGSFIHYHSNPIKTHEHDCNASDDSLEESIFSEERHKESRREHKANSHDTAENVFDNTNRHNKNIVIWKDGYIVPFTNALHELGDEIEKYFKDLIRICSDDSSNSTDSESDNEEYSESLDLEDVTCEFKEDDVGSDTNVQNERKEGHVDTNDLSLQFVDDEISKNSECSLTHSGKVQSCSVKTDAAETTARLAGQISSNSHGEEDNNVSERSSYSTDSCDENNGYEIVDWSIDWGLEQDRQSHGTEKHDRYDTPPTSPTNEHSDSNVFHTATSSPISKTESFCMIDKPDSLCESNNACALPLSPKNEKCTDEHLDSFTDIGDAAAACAGGQSNNAISSERNASNDVIALDTWEVPESYKIKSTHVQTSSSYDCYRYPFPNRRRSSQPMKIPPFIDVNAIQYEADPKTGIVRSVGKGSFGQVYKARFFDPRYHHLSIVVKEFDEEFTSKNEIVAEAQKLLHLQNTDYVPACYGLVNLGSVERPRYGIVQEYVGSGMTLEQLLWEQYDLPMEMWLSVALQCCEGLDLFHKKGILLNDIKSNNVIPEFYQDLVSIKYIDFGLATGMNGKRYKDTKSLEEFVYLAPEVRIKGKVTSISSDIYSLGFMLDQISSSAWSAELKFIAAMCMKNDPVRRATVSLAATYIRNHMIRLGCDTNRHREYHQVVGQRYW